MLRLRIKNKKIYTLVRTLIIILGASLMGFAFSSIFHSNKIFPSGFSGICAIISDLLLLKGIYIPTSVFYILINIVLFVFAWKYKGKEFCIFTIIGITAYTLTMQFLNFNFLFEDSILCIIYGGAIMGIGLGLVLIADCSTGGSDLLGATLNKINPKFTVGNVLIVTNICCVIFSAIVYGITNSLYAIIGIYLIGKVADVISEGTKTIKAYYIISEKNEEISKSIIEKTQHTLTSIHAHGNINKTNTTMLLCLVSSFEAQELKNIVYEIDNSAFIFCTNVKEAMNGGFDYMYIKSKYQKRYKANKVILKNKLKKEIEKQD